VLNRPDFSDYLVHFTSDRAPFSKQSKIPVDKFVEMTAYDKLISILNAKEIYASRMPRTGATAVCLTECPWSSLLSHTKVYSPYGIGFSKSLVFSRHGAPALYVRWDTFNNQKWDKKILPYVTPFWPAYRPKSLGDHYQTCDYSHEREWRIPHHFSFEYDQIEFVVLDTYEDMAKFPKELKDEIGRDKFLLMDNYRTIEKLWPVHIIDSQSPFINGENEPLGTK
jgi:hypothetical protein